MVVGAPPQIRVDGILQALNYPQLSPDQTKSFSDKLLTPDQRKDLAVKRGIDFSFGITNFSRFRANIFYQRNSISLALRRIPYEIPDFDFLGIPKQIQELANRNNGLVLVTGPTGSGKSTTLAALIDKINTEKNAHIVTIEDPIEYLHSHKRSLVNQRQIGADATSFETALRHVLRQDPDVILIGELRDFETIEIALILAETGHLVFGTLHTNSCAQTVNRIIDVFPSNQQDQARVQLSLVLQGVVAQLLLPKPGGGRVLATEIMIATPAVRSTIREGRIHQLDNLITTGQQYGMQTLNHSLLELVQNGYIQREIAMTATPNPGELEQLMHRQGI